MTLVANSPENKLSHEDIQQSLWPLVQDESFVNSLNVTLSALRKVISPYEKEIIHQNKTVAFGKGIRVIHTD
jgi:DNA-binding SARP family transcriptional activator